MTATRLGTATFLAVVGLTCDITEVAEPSYNPNAELELTPRDLSQSFIVRLYSFETIRFSAQVFGGVE